MSVASSSTSACSVDGEGRPCMVCGAEAHGIHFQVNSCRACAAFFRRSVDIEQKYKCRRGNFKCDVSKDAFQCRRCRYQRCRQMGMTLDGISPQADEKSTEIMPIVPSAKPSAKSARESDPFEDNPNDEFNAHRHKFDETNMKQLINYHFNNPAGVPKPLSLRNLLHHYENMVSEGKPEKIEFVATMDLGEGLYFYGENIIRIAAWMMNSTEFSQLQIAEKWKLFTRLWPVMEILERSARTYEYLGISCSPSVYLLTDKCAIDLNVFEYSMPQLDADLAQRVIENYRPVCRMQIDAILIPMQKLNPTNMEVVYLCLYKMWDIHRIRGLSTETYKLGETVLHQISDEIHDYYLNERKIDNYANRLAKLAKLLTEIEGCVRFRNNIELAMDAYQMLGFEFNDTEVVVGDDE